MLGFLFDSLTIIDVVAVNVVVEDFVVRVNIVVSVDVILRIPVRFTVTIPLSMVTEVASKTVQRILAVFLIGFQLALSQMKK